MMLSFALQVRFFKTDKHHHHNSQSKAKPKLGFYTSLVSLWTLWLSMKKYKGPFTRNDNPPNFWIRFGFFNLKYAKKSRLIRIRNLNCQKSAFGFWVQKLGGFCFRIRVAFSTIYTSFFLYKVSLSYVLRNWRIRAGHIINKDFIND